MEVYGNPETGVYDFGDHLQDCLHQTDATVPPLPLSEEDHDVPVQLRW